VRHLAVTDADVAAIVGSHEDFAGIDVGREEAAEAPPAPAPPPPPPTPLIPLARYAPAPPDKVRARLAADARAAWQTRAGQGRADSGRAGPGWAGIWFHPHALESVWRWAPPLGKRWALRGRIHRFLRRARAGRAPEALWVLDEDARRWLGAVRASIPGHVLPDPFEREPRLDRAAARRALGLPADRVIFLHLGSAEPRKGLPDTLGAFVEVIAGEAGAKPARRARRAGLPRRGLAAAA
jgi:hypothetical protein